MLEKNQKKPRFRTQFDFEPSQGEENSQIDNVRRSGYIPAEVQLRTMEIAGIKLQLARDEMYSYDDDTQIDDSRSVPIPRYMDTFEAKEYLNHYEAKLKKFKNASEHAKALEARYQEKKKELQLSELRKQNQYLTSQNEKLAIKNT